jgi:hypothetical protein
MNKKGQLYRPGRWTIKPGRIEEFISAWQTSVDWLIEPHTRGWSGETVLLQDTENSHKFISFAWTTNPQQIEELLTGREFQSFMPVSKNSVMR